MRLLKRVLDRCGCRAAGGNPGHLESCPGCRARQEQERRYLERLRGAAIPAASGDLTARLLARTEQLAAGPPGLMEPGGSIPSGRPGPAGVPGRLQRAVARILRSLAP